MLKAVVAYLVDQGFNDVRTREDKDNAPKGIAWKGNERGFKPDVVAMNHGTTYIFSVEKTITGSSDLMKEKWKLFSEYAKQKDGEFYLVVPSRKKRVTHRLLDQENINARVLEVEV